MGLLDYVTGNIKKKPVKKQTAIEKAPPKPKKEKKEIAVGENQEFNLEHLISQGISKGLPIETMKELLAMRKQLKDEWAKEQYYISLSEFQAYCPIIKKKATVNFKSPRTGRVTNYNYASLDMIVSQVKIVLREFGFSYTVKTKQNDNSVTAICMAHHKSGYSEETEFTVPIDKAAYMNEAQKVASALTYAKRYAFCNAFGVMTGDEDDDVSHMQNIGKPGNRSLKERLKPNVPRETPEKPEVKIVKKVGPAIKNLMKVESPKNEVAAGYPGAGIEEAEAEIVDEVAEDIMGTPGDMEPALDALDDVAKKIESDMTSKAKELIKLGKGLLDKMDDVQREVILKLETGKLQLNEKNYQNIKTKLLKIKEQEDANLLPGINKKA